MTEIHKVTSDKPPKTWKEIAKPNEYGVLVVLQTKKEATEAHKKTEKMRQYIGVL